jgi:two-component system, LytTR family, response regulator
MTDTIQLPGNGFIRTDTVVHCDSNDGGCTIYLNNGNTQVIDESIETVGRQLPPHQFVRLHPSHIVNVDFINRYVEAPAAHVVLHNGAKIPVSAAAKKRFSKLLDTL